MNEIVQAVRVLRYVGARRAVERTLDNSIQGTLVIRGSKTGALGGVRVGWRPDLPPLTIHAESLGRPEVMAIGVGYEEGHRVLTNLVMEANDHLPAEKADTMWAALREAGYSIVRTVV